MNRRWLNLRSDTLIATLAILLFTLVVSFGALVLSWLSYNEKYGISFLDFLVIAL
jgi:hypothetical protein|tara:strand:+ start:438 stop:602 length:165 start_codon:yes stop_codon:yes gene_type:complete